MKKIFLTLAIFGVIAACKNTETKDTPTTETPATETADIDKNYQSIGDAITDANAVSKSEMLEKYKALELGDTLNLKFSSKVKEVCQNKGCWMKVDLGEEEAMITFKDYGFFMPKDLAGQEVVMEGKAYIEEMSVEDQRHYAEDGGATQEEVLAITEPKRTYSFKAHGVLIPEPENQ